MAAAGILIAVRHFRAHETSANIQNKLNLRKEVRTVRRSGPTDVAAPVQPSAARFGGSVPLPIRRTNEGERLALVSSVDAEVLLVDGQDEMPGMNLTHSNQAQICEVRTPVGIALRQCGELRDVFQAVESQGHEPVVDHVQYRCGTTQMKRGFGKYRLARQKRHIYPSDNGHRPGVVGISPVRKRNQKARVGDSFHVREKPLRADRPFGPLMIPARRMNDGSPLVRLPFCR